MSLIDIRIEGDQRVATHLGLVGERVVKRLTRIITQCGVMLVGGVRRDKLSGQVLKVRSGRLRRSIDSRVIGAGTEDVAAIVGTSVEYAAAHEFGAHQVVTVKEHLRRVTQAWGRPLKDPRMATVRAHPMRQNIPEHSFLRSELREMTPDLIRKIDDGVREAINE